MTGKVKVVKKKIMRMKLGDFFKALLDTEERSNPDRAKPAKIERNANLGTETVSTVSPRLLTRVTQGPARRTHFAQGLRMQ